MDPVIKYCCSCAAGVSLRVPEGDNLPRYVCDACGAIHYRNPRLVVGTLPLWQDQVLLCRRAIEPRKGFWTLPAGFMENGEAVETAAIRETQEEACAEINLGGLYTMISVPHINQVHLFFQARLLNTNFAPGHESLAVELFSEATLPWNELAFRSVSMTLQHYFADRKHANTGVHLETIFARN